MLSIIAVTIILIGLVLFPLPIPVGIFFIIAGIAMLLTVNPTAQQKLKTLRASYPKVDQLLTKATHSSPGFIKRILLKTEIDTP